MVFVLTMVFVVSACGFKEHYEPVAASAAQGTLRATWTEVDTGKKMTQNRILEGNSLVTLKSSLPLIVPVSFPQDLQIEFSSQGVASAGTRVDIFGWSGSKEGVGYNIGGSKPDAGNSLIGYLPGLNQVLKSDLDTPAKVEIRVSNGDGSAIIASAEIEVMVPPTKIGSEQLNVADFERAYGSIEPGARVLHAIADDLVLVQVLTLSNQTTWSTHMELPVKLTGQLASSVNEIDVQSNFCSHSVSKKAWARNVSSNLVLLPIEANIAENFSSMLSHALAQGSWKYDLSPNEKKVVGIYAVGKSAVDVMSNTYQPLQMEETTVVTSCKSYCGIRGVYWVWNWQYGATRYWKDHGYPGGSDACEKAMCGGPIMDSQITTDLCNQCAEWEISNGTGAYDDHRYCRGAAPGDTRLIGEPWHIQKTTEKIVAGKEEDSLILTLANESTPVFVRYTFQGQTENLPSRKFSDLITPSKTLKHYCNGGCSNVHSEHSS